LWALKEQGASAILAVASVGGIRGCVPGDLVLPHQLIDYTSGRAQTFFDGGDQQVVHVDFTHPYRERLRALFQVGARQGRITLRDGGVYGAVSGPRLETAAEIDRMERDGATLVGMTGMPEAVLARELGIDYASVCVVVNHAAGRGDSRSHVSMEGIANVLESAMDDVRALIQHVVPLVPGEPRAHAQSITPAESEVIQDGP
jgi:5'-methylthioadenosine phosphorylase